MKSKRYLKNLTSLVLVLSCCIYFGCTPQPLPPREDVTDVEKDFIESFTTTQGLGYPLDVSTHISGKTFWIYIATQKDIMQLVIIRRCLRLCAIGIAIGILLSVPLGCAVKSSLYQVGAVDPMAYVGVITLFLLVAMLSGYLPARRATRVDPLTALRCE